MAEAILELDSDTVILERQEFNDDEIQQLPKKQSKVASKVVKIQRSDLAASTTSDVEGNDKSR